MSLSILSTLSTLQADGRPDRPTAADAEGLRRSGRYPPHVSYVCVSHVIELTWTRVKVYYGQRPPLGQDRGDRGSHPATGYQRVKTVQGQPV